MKNIIMLHGWGYKSYSKIAKHVTPWYNKKSFIDDLKKQYNVFAPIFPGFCGIAEPKKTYDLDDYAKYIDNYIKLNNIKIDFILGNSFGGEVAVRYKTLINSSIPIILIVPAILRKYTNSKEFIKTPNMLKPIRNFLRDLYVIYIKRTPEMKFGTKFLRNSYQKIVRYNLLNELKQFKSSEVLVLLGINDRMIDTDIIYGELAEKFKYTYRINGGHEIIETHKDELLNYILKFTNN